MSTTPQIAESLEDLDRARNDKVNADTYIRRAMETISGLDEYVRQLEEANATYINQLRKLRDESARLRRRVR